MRTVNILLIEDNEGDILLTKEAFEDAKIQVELNVVVDGKEAIDYLSKKGKYSNQALPDLLLLDINLPKINGHQVLKYIKSSDDLKQLPVIMLTTSSSEKDINLAYNEYVNCFITKPLDISEFMSVVVTIQDFWISIVKLPTKK